MIGACRHRARVDDHEISPIARDRFGATGAELRLEREGVGLIDPAAEGNEGILHDSKVQKLTDSQFKPEGRLTGFELAVWLVLNFGKSLPADVSAEMHSLELNPRHG